MKESAVLELKLSTLPEEPGVYQYYDETNQIIYVGKAKNLKKRILSYFHKNHENKKTRVLVSKIRDLHYTVVFSEEDALLLENSLIKQNQPRYNILLKDDKTYPHICIKNERFPRVFKTRTVEKDGSLYFGPYGSTYGVKILLDLIRRIYPLRTCKHNLSTDNISKKKYKVCLEYHIHNCKGACIGKEQEAKYEGYIKEIKEILKGNISKVNHILYQEMEQLADELRFEEAQKIKEKYDLLENFRQKSMVVSHVISEVEVFSYDETEDNAYINYIYVNNGVIVQSQTLEYRKRLDEPKEEVLALGITELRERFKNKTKEIVVPFSPDGYWEKIAITIPQKGEKRKLLDLSLMNVKQYKADRIKQQDKLNPEQKVAKLMTTMQKDLRLKELPLHIECFDNSNIQGSYPVSACVVFRKGKPSKRDYRHYHVKTVEGPDDFATMREVLTRRYTRLMNEEQPLPQLVIVDGGKGQLSSAVEIFKEIGLWGKVALIGIAKQLEEIYFPSDSLPLYLNKKSETLRVIQHLRDESHRFGITFHRNTRSKGQVRSILDDIPGIGVKTKEQLLKKYKSWKRISEAPTEELTALIGEKKMMIIKDFAKNK